MAVIATKTAPYAATIEDTLSILETDADHGLSNDLVTRRRAEFGPNELAEAPPIPRWKKFLGQFKDLVIWILIAAAIISGLVGEWSDTVAILAIVLLNGVLGYFQEERAEQALAKLRKLSSPTAKVHRNGTLQTIPAVDLVAGDVIELEAGDNIPADSRLIRSFGLRVHEASLTGESVPVDKSAAKTIPIETPLADRQNMAFMGTVVAAGKGTAVVVAIGMRTELGKIAGLMQRFESEPTPLQRRLEELGKVLIVICLVLVSLIFALQIWRGGQLLPVFLTAVSLAVAAVPEGLPAVVTLSLAIGLQRMVKRNALIRKLPSVETLGAVTVICSDKTGTLTRNEMTVREILAGGVKYRVSGVGYLPRGEFAEVTSTGTSIPIDPQGAADLIQLLTVAMRCNNASLAPIGKEGDQWSVTGDPTEGALVVAAFKAGIEPNNAVHRAEYEIPFDSERKAMSVIMRDASHRLVMYTKGAPEVILAKCTTELRSGRCVPLTDERRKEVTQSVSDMSSRALRVLAFAYRELPTDVKQVSEERDLVFAGLMGMLDPPREEAKDAVQRCHGAGIRPIMITGDHPATARAIARELGIASDSDRVVTGQELDAFSDDQLTENVESIAVYARVTAEHKLRVVRAWKACHQVVAMTGDGVNDAPAIKAADIGIAMGVSGTDVTKEASAMILTDDNFASIVNAVEEGRAIYDNIQKFLHFLLAGNLGLILFVFASSMFGWPFPLTTMQILWMNLVTNGLPALALGLEPPERDVMRRRPRQAGERIITWRRGFLMLVHGFIVAAVTSIGFALVYGGDEAHLARARTMAFCVISYAFIFYSLTCRSQRYTLPQLGFFSNPALLGAIAISGLLQLSVVMLPYARPVFDTVGHFAWEWVLLIVLALTPVTIIELWKIAQSWMQAGRRV